MLIRILIFLAILLAISFVVWRLKPHPLARVPRRWKQLAGRDPRFGQALGVRNDIGKVLIRGHAMAALGVLDDVDSVLERLSQMIEGRRTLSDLSRTADVDESLATIDAEVDRVLKVLGDTRAVVIELVGAELRGEVDQLRSTLQAQRADLEAVIGAHAEIGEMLEDQG